MNRVTTANSYSSVLADLMQAQSRQAQASIEVSSGKKANDLKGFARDAENLAATQSVKTRTEGFLAQSKTLASKLDVQNLALTQTADAAQAAKQAVLDALASGSSQGLVSELQSAFSDGIQGLNTQSDGHYLFSGGQVDTKPVSATQLSDLTAGPLSALFHNDTLVPVSRLDESTTVQSGFLADQIGQSFFTALQNIQSYLDANGGPFPATLGQADVTFLTAQVANLETARSDLTNTAAQNGLSQQRVDRSISDQQSRVTILTGALGDITDVDMGDAISRLNQAQTAVQASAQVFSTLKNTSLLNYITF